MRLPHSKWVCSQLSKANYHPNFILLLAGVAPAGPGLTPAGVTPTGFGSALAGMASTGFGSSKAGRYLDGWFGSIAKANPVDTVRC